MGDMIGKHMTDRPSTNTAQTRCLKSLDHWEFRKRFISVWRRRPLGEFATSGISVRGYASCWRFRRSALLRFKNQRRTISLSGGDLFIFILSDEPFTLVDHTRSAVVDSRKLRRLEQNRSHAFQSVLDLLAAETAQPGIASSCLINCLYESLFV